MLCVYFVYLMDFVNFEGDTSFIGAHAVKLGGAYFDGDAVPIVSLLNYTNSNKDKDEWVYLEIESTGSGSNGMECHSKPRRMNG